MSRTKNSFLIAIAAFFLLMAATTAFAAEVESGVKGTAVSTRWRSNSITIALSRSLLENSSHLKPGTDVEAALRSAVAQWEAVSDIQIKFVETDRQDASPAGNRGDGISLVTIAQTSENHSLFSPGDTSVSAKTRVFTDRFGFITEADIVLNPYAIFSSDGSFSTYDLEGVLTHEIGHLLGLRHSALMGSVMHGNVDVNSTIGPGFATRKMLSAEDISSIRGRYGVAESDSELCCGRVSGKIAGSEKIIAGSLILLENERGQIAGATRLKANGEFAFDGLSSGSYAAILSREGVGTLAEDLGPISVDPGKSVRFEAKATAEVTPFELAYVGVDGLLSNSAVKLSPGSLDLVTVGGRGLSADAVSIYTSSPYIRVDESTVVDVDYSDQISAIRFQVTVDPKAPPGAYSIFVAEPSGFFAVLPGAISVAR